MAQSGEFRFTSVVALMFVMALSCVHADVLKSDGGSEDTSSLRQRMDELEGLLFEQSGLLRQQAEQLSGQDMLLRAQAEQLIHQDSTIRQLKETVNDQDSSIRQLKATVNKLQPTPDQTRSSFIDALAVQLAAKESTSVSANSVPADATDEGGKQSSNDVNIRARSDDAGPLDMVVSQMGQQVTEMSADIQTLKNANSQQDQQIQDARTSTYVHWGSSQCSGSSQLVYSGVVGGSHYTQSGAATNYLCLTMSPVLSDHSLPGGRAYLYGGEYQTEDTHYETDAECSVCRSSHSTTIMIPGANVCTPGWQRQYSGYLMAGDASHPAGSEFICVDSAMEGRPGTNRNDNGKLLYFTVAHCGSLPCQPYVDNKIITCVVCSQ